MKPHFAVLFALLSISLLLPACNATMPPRHKQYILEKAPADLECERAKIKFKALGKSEYEVTGCGAKAAYRVVCNELNECEAQATQVPVPLRTDPAN